MSNIRSSRNGSSTDKRLWTTTTSRSKKMQCPAENRRPFQRECRGRVQQPITPVVAHVIRPLHIFFYFVLPIFPITISSVEIGGGVQMSSASFLYGTSFWRNVFFSPYAYSTIRIYVCSLCRFLMARFEYNIFYTKKICLAVVVCFDPPCYFL